MKLTAGEIIKQVEEHEGKIQEHENEILKLQELRKVLNVARFKVRDRVRCIKFN